MGCIDERMLYARMIVVKDCRDVIKEWLEGKEGIEILVHNLGRQYCCSIEIPGKLKYFYDEDTDEMVVESDNGSRFGFRPVKVDGVKDHAMIVRGQDSIIVFSMF